ncbi:MAG: cysteine desulfurase NifS [Deltaproteobacteria bacterium RIFCSPLOWO2_12_FULL_60_19]|nr:MAG: cysteine desulfurase NifS [Deltaproteobacteria bacterium RIFCSPLOWO2_12_FULL_60_19]
MNGIYLDNNATTKVDEKVFLAMRQYLTCHFAHPSSPHLLGAKVRQKLEEARDLVAVLLGTTHPDEIVFTSGGTESINTAIQGALAALPSRRHIVTTKVEHASVLNVCRYLATQGYRITYLSVDGQGRLDLDELRKSLREETALVSVMWANNETGVVFPIEEIGEIVKGQGVLLHVDAVQAVGRVPINLRRLAEIDLLSLSGHKFHAPKGVGALFVRRGVRLHPLILGGPQERNRRGGTENVASIIGMGKAAELASIYFADENTRVRGLRDKLEKGLLQQIPHAIVNGSREARIPNTTNVTFRRLMACKLLKSMADEGIYASSGAASTEVKTPSHVLLAMGLTEQDALSSVRFGLSRYNTEEDVDYTVGRLARIVGHTQIGVASAETIAMH